MLPGEEDYFFQNKFQDYTCSYFSFESETSTADTGLLNSGSYIDSLPLEQADIEEINNLDKRLIYLMQLHQCKWERISAYFSDDQLELTYKRFQVLISKGDALTVLSPVEILTQQKYLLEYCLGKMKNP